ncbi:MAG: hypothetical protein ACPGJF_05740 [Sinimarinibacterium flocculans]|uniref:hypothetical protein n=1 Tax=Sinimarinibacterium flocculans TaxID=985250 RepID=UPI003C6A14A8
MDRQSILRAIMIGATLMGLAGLPAAAGNTPQQLGPLQWALFQQITEGGPDAVSRDPRISARVREVLSESYGVEARAFRGGDCGSAIDSILTRSFRSELRGIRDANFGNAIRDWCPSGGAIVNGLSAFLADVGVAVRNYNERIAQAQSEQRQAAEQAARAEKEERDRQWAEEERRRNEASARSEALARERRAEAEAKNEALHAALQGCRQTASYRTFVAATSVQRGIRMVAEGKRTLEREEAIEKASGGVSNLFVRREAGEKIVAGNSIVEQGWAEYKALGGTADKPESIAVTDSPCKAQEDVTPLW